MELAGNFFLWIAVVLAALAAAAAMIGVWGVWDTAGGTWTPRRWVELSVRSMSASALSGLASVGLLAASFFLDDFRIRSVQAASSRDLNPWFKVSLLWVDLETSMLFWACVLAAVSALALGGLLHRISDVDRGGAGQGDAESRGGKRDQLTGGAAMIFGLLAALFFSVVLVRYNPFDPFLVERPLYGAGMKPLLRNFWMLIHPPVQYLGYGLSVVPFALVMSALVTDHPLDKKFLDVLRPWILAAWLALAVGMVLGMVWAYGEVDWGGYWNWDPVENASLMPFVMGTVALHALLLDRRGRRSRGWLAFSVFATFWLTILGAFLTRTGAVDSVHSFGKDSFLLRVLGGLLVVGIVTSGAVLWWKRRSWSDRQTPGRRWRFDFVTSIVLCNWVLTAAVLVVLVGSVGPLFWKVFAGKTIKVQQTFFENWLVPVGVVTGMLVGMAYALRSPKGESKISWMRFVPGTVGAVAGLSLIATRGGTSGWALAVGGSAGFALGQAGFVVVWLGLVGRRPKAAAAGLVHVGLALVLLGLSGRSGLVRAQRDVAAGAEFHFGPATLQYLGPRQRDDLESNRVYALVRMAGRVIQPGLVAYLSSPDMPVGRTATIASWWRDVQIRLLGVRRDGTATFQVVIHPLASWMWVGFGLMFLAGLVLLLRRPSRPRGWVHAYLGGWLVGTLGLSVWLWFRWPSDVVANTVLVAAAVALAFPGAMSLASLAFWLLAPPETRLSSNGSSLRSRPPEIEAPA